MPPPLLFCWISLAWWFIMRRSMETRLLLASCCYCWQNILLLLVWFSVIISLIMPLRAFITRVWNPLETVPLPEHLGQMLDLLAVTPVAWHSKQGNRGVSGWKC